MIDSDKMFEILWHSSGNELVEFVETRDSFGADDLGRYYSALSNEANLRGMDFAWMVLGVESKKRTVVGTNFKLGEDILEGLKNDLSSCAKGNQIFVKMVEKKVEGKRLLLLKVPSAPRNIAMCWKDIA